MTFQWRKCVFTTVCLASLTAPAAFAQDPDLTYHTVAPCIVLDTRVAGGAFTAGTTRTYNVTGTGSLASQGGSSTGCGIPGFSNNIAQVQAVAVNIVTINPSGAGHVQAFAADTTTTTSVINFSTGVNLANTTHLAVAQTSGVGDFKITVSVSASHILVSVVGYYSKAVQTVYVHPVPGDATASGTRLLNALAGITNASATKRYVIKVEPGIYDVGSTMLEMKPYVDIEGSGQEATVIEGDGNEESSMTAIVQGADFAELRGLQVKSVGVSPQDFSVGIALDDADTTIRNVTVKSSGAGSNWGIRMVESSPLIEEVNIEVTGAGYNYGLVTDVGSEAIVRRSVIKVEDTGTSGTKNGIYMEDGGFPKELTDVEIIVKGGTTGTGIDVGFGTGTPTITIRNSKIVVSGSSTATYGINNALAGFQIFASHIEAIGSNSIGLDDAGGAVRVMSSTVSGEVYTVLSAYAEIGSTFLNGGAAVAATCAGVYDESFIFYASTCP
jgi:hypothetical protein